MITHASCGSQRARDALTLETLGIRSPRLSRGFTLLHINILNTHSSRSSHRRPFVGLECALLPLAPWSRMCPQRQAAFSVLSIVPCIFGAGVLVGYASTRSVFDGCFQAYNPIVIEPPLPSSLSSVWGPYTSVWAVSLLTTALVCRSRSIGGAPGSSFRVRENSARR